MEPSNKLTAALTHLSILTQYFIPFGNFLFPILIWTAAKSKSEFADHHGKQAINFQLSILLYSIVLCLIAITVLLYSVFNNVAFSEIFDNENVFDNISMANMTGIATIAIIAVFILILLKIFEFFLVICASVKAASGERFYYPLTIPFIGKSSPEQADEMHHHEIVQQPQP